MQSETYLCMWKFDHFTLFAICAILGRICKEKEIIPFITNRRAYYISTASNFFLVRLWISAYFLVSKFCSIQSQNIRFCIKVGVAVLLLSLLLFWSLSHVQLFVTPWTIARQAPLFVGFLRQEHWTGLPFPSPGGSCYRDLS